MPLGWFITPYKRRDLILDGFLIRPGRYCAMDDFSEQIFAEGGTWEEIEVLGDSAVVKVRASNALLSTIDAAPNFIAIPRRWVDLTSSFANMTNGERNQINNKLQSLGYTTQEITAVMGSNLTSWRARTLDDLLGLLCSKRFKPARSGNDYVFTTEQVPVKPYTDVDVRITE